MRLLYIYPEEWTGRRAREVHTLSTCVALAQSGLEVTLVTAGGLRPLQEQVRDVAGRAVEPGLSLAALPRNFGPIRSASIFAFNLRQWLKLQVKFDAAYLIHLKAVAMAVRAELPYLYEAHEIFAETPQKDALRAAELGAAEKKALAGAAWRVATSRPLAAALRTRYELADDIWVVPNAGPAPLAQSLAALDGPMVYAGSIADWKGLETVIEATRIVDVRLKIVGGTEAEWQRLSARLETGHVAWEPRVPLAELPRALAGSCAGLIPTRPETPSGRYSCPMKLFDYARCGLPVLSTALPSLESLDVGSWCTQVPEATVAAWVEAMGAFHANPVQGETARAWAGAHTWTQRAEMLIRLLYTQRAGGETA
jgi:glycosyltransferase involved in cell wall biosynthesis